MHLSRWCHDDAADIKRRYVEDPHPYEGTGYCGFIPAKLLRELGVALVDDTIPGVAVLAGKAPTRDSWSA